MWNSLNSLEPSTPHHRCRWHLSLEEADDLHPTISPRTLPLPISLWLVCRVGTCWQSSYWRFRPTVSQISRRRAAPC